TGGFDLSGEAVDVVLTRDVAGADVDRDAVRLPQLLLAGGQAIGVAGEDEEISAFGGQPFADGQAEAHAAADDQRALAGNSQVHVLSFRLDQAATATETAPVAIRASRWRSDADNALCIGGALRLVHNA